MEERRCRTFNKGISSLGEIYNSFHEIRKLFLAVSYRTEARKAVTAAGMRKRWGVYPWG